MGSKNIFKHTTYENKGDTLEVKIRDEIGNYFYKGKARTKCRKEVNKLLDDLRQKGVVMGSENGWFD